MFRRQAVISIFLIMAVSRQGLAQRRPLAKVWKDPNCGCCKDWISHLQDAGFDVQVLDTGNTAARTRLGIPQMYGSCHTAQIGGYAIEGHVPASDIHRLLRETPNAIGLALPGMPVGSPGMDGPAYGGHKEIYEVLLIAKDGNSTVYQTHR